MKKLIIATVMLFAFTMTFAQNDENTSFKKNEISLAPYTANFTYYNATINNDWLRTYPNYDLFRTNYRRYLDENTALRFGLGANYSNFLGLDLNVRAGLEKYLSLSPKFQLYGGGQLNLSAYNIGNDVYQFYGAGVDLIGGIRYNINDKWSISSEVIAPLKYNWSANGPGSNWEIGAKWQPLKLNFSF